MISYTTAYENSLHFSPRFQQYACDLVKYLANAYELKDRSVIEVGCGKGEFLRMLVESTHARGIGFDPSVPDTELSESYISFIQDYYSEKYSEFRCRLLCCRHVLEHIAAPVPFLRMLRSALEPDGALFCEVPNGTLSITARGMWDVIYPHISYFTLASLRATFRQAGFEVVRSQVAFGDQYLWVEAVPVSEPIHSTRDAAEDGIAEPVETFRATYDSTIAHWRGRISEWTRQNARIVVWGAGAKGVTFLNAVSDAGRVHAVIDANPRKWDTFTPVSGVAVIPPDKLRSNPPDVMLLMNAVYESEIRDQLAAMSIAPRVIESVM